MSDDDGETYNRFIVVRLHFPLAHTDTHPTQSTACRAGIVRHGSRWASRRSSAACTDKGRMRRGCALLLPSPRTPRPPAPLQIRPSSAGDDLRMPSACTRPCAREAPPVRGAFAALQGRAYRARDLALPSHLRSRAAAAPAAAQTHVVASARPCPYPSPYSAAATPRLPSLALAHPWYCYLSVLACNTSVCRRRIRVRVRNL
ncbi:hypothetical protein B0H17DRAFT_1109168 [Mycena rosella]|uniref:Uncharacterized protein n=1 Tax=Mycena rosella TaxID=1033263 RepID=A0AAD7BV08_MYCRO|nr:hypothetical protein B0H17DRAFT_1109168 [Mycena rosella]